MFRRLLAPAILLASLSACSQPASPPASDAAATPAVGSATDATAANAAPAPATDAVAPAQGAVPPATVEAATPPAVPDPNAPEPRVGTDYEAIAVPQPTWGTADGRIELAEVFSYQCVHCAEFQPLVTQYTSKLPADVRWEYVPAAFGGTWNDFARAYFAADVMGVQKRTHDAVFNGVFIDKKIKTGKPEEIADLYASLGVDRVKFVAAMNSFGVTAKLNRAKQFGLRTGVTATPTLIINGKWRINVTTDRGFKGMLETANFLIQKERVASAGIPGPATGPAITASSPTGR